MAQYVVYHRVSLDRLVVGVFNMKTFKKWLLEDSPANSIAGGGIRGMGNVTGDPNGDITNYATNNATEQGQVSSDVQSMIDSHNNMMTTDGDDGNTTDGGDQPANVIGYKVGMKGGGTANYKGSTR
jgi:hypothetical protein